MKAWPEHYQELPSLARYIDRVGAEQVSFRKFEIPSARGKSKGHYASYRGAIHVDFDGSIRLTKVADEGAYEPTEDEIKAIKEEFAKLKEEGCSPPLPAYVSLQIAEKKRIELKLDPFNWFIFVNASRSQMSFCQQRIPDETGKGNYTPWTYFNDGKWRNMEPGDIDGLPFWKPQEDLSDNVMIHEGAKSARFCDWMTRGESDEARDALLRHPWGAELKNYSHWGWIGGAPNAHKTNWKELLSVQPNEIVMVCDNDDPGRGALYAVARYLRGQKLFAIKFDHFDHGRWPEGFDLADPWPDDEDFYSPDGYYIGPHFFDCLHSATWATQPVATKKKEKGRPKTDALFQLTDKFKDQWRYIEFLNVFTPRLNRSNHYSDIVFNRLIRPFSDVDNTAALAIKEGMMHAHHFCYEPGFKGWIKMDGGHEVANTWTATTVEPMKGAIAPFIEFMEHLIPEKKDRDQVIKWCATLAVCLKVRMMYGLLLVSQAQGVGKSTLMEKIMAPIVGWQNVSTPTEATIVNNNFNSWIARKRLILCHEIYAGHSRAAYNRLSSLITENQIEVQEKYVREYQIKNWAHFMLSSNSRAALNLPREDRRIFAARVTEELQPKEYWRKFNWYLINGGLEAIFAYFHEYIEKHKAIEQGAHAPESQLKDEIIEESKQEWQHLVSDFILKIRSLAEKEGETILIEDREVTRLILEVISTFPGTKGKFTPGYGAIIKEITSGEAGFKIAGYAKTGSGTRVRRLSIGCKRCDAGKNKELVKSSQAQGSQKNWVCPECGNCSQTERRFFLNVVKALGPKYD